MPKISLISPPFVALFASQKSAGKTTLATFMADFLAVNNVKFRAFQVDDQKRLGFMIGDEVVDLRPNPDRLIEDPTLITRALTPLYEAARQAAIDKSVIGVDTGANEVENLTNFLRDVEFDEDAKSWGLPILAFVPFYALDPESTAQSAYTVKRLLNAVPSARIILVQNQFGGSIDRIVPGSMAETNFRALLASAKTANHIVMPAMAREYWTPFEAAGVRFIKVLSIDAAEGSALIGRSIGEFKIARSNIVRFWQSMHGQITQIIDLPLGGK